MQLAKSTAPAADIEVIDSYSAYHMKPDDYVVQLVGEAARHIGLEPVQQGTGGGSDANIINGRGIPSVVLGMGYENIHSTAESIPCRPADQGRTAGCRDHYIEQTSVTATKGLRALFFIISASSCGISLPQREDSGCR